MNGKTKPCLITPIKHSQVEDVGSSYPGSRLCTTQFLSPVADVGHFEIPKPCARSMGKATFQKLRICGSRIKYLQPNLVSSTTQSVSSKVQDHDLGYKNISSSELFVLDQHDIPTSSFVMCDNQVIEIVSTQEGFPGRNKTSDLCPQVQSDDHNQLHLQTSNRISTPHAPSKTLKGTETSSDLLKKVQSGWEVVSQFHSVKHDTCFPWDAHETENEVRPKPTLFSKKRAIENKFPVHCSAIGQSNQTKVNAISKVNVLNTKKSHDMIQHQSLFQKQEGCPEEVSPVHNNSTSIFPGGMLSKAHVPKRYYVIVPTNVMLVKDLKDKTGGTVTEEEVRIQDEKEIMVQDEEMVRVHDEEAVRVQDEEEVMDEDEVDALKMQSEIPDSSAVAADLDLHSDEDVNDKRRAILEEMSVLLAKMQGETGEEPKQADLSDVEHVEDKENRKLCTDPIESVVIKQEPLDSDRVVCRNTSSSSISLHKPTKLEIIKQEPVSDDDHSVDWWSKVKMETLKGQVFSDGDPATMVTPHIYLDTAQTVDTMPETLPKIKSCMLNRGLFDLCSKELIADNGDYYMKRGVNLQGDSGKDLAEGNNVRMSKNSHSKCSMQKLLRDDIAKSVDTVQEYASSNKHSTYAIEHGMSDTVTRKQNRGKMVAVHAGRMTGRYQREARNGMQRHSERHSERHSANSVHSILSTENSVKELDRKEKQNSGNARISTGNGVVQDIGDEKNGQVSRQMKELLQLCTEAAEFSEQRGFGDMGCSKRKRKRLSKQREALCISAGGLLARRGTKGQSPVRVGKLSEHVENTKISDDLDDHLTKQVEESDENYGAVEEIEPSLEPCNKSYRASENAISVEKMGALDKIKKKGRVSRQIQELLDICAEAEEFIDQKDMSEGCSTGLLTRTSRRLLKQKVALSSTSNVSRQTVGGHAPFSESKVCKRKSKGLAPDHFPAGTVEDVTHQGRHLEAATSVGDKPLLELEKTSTSSPFKLLIENAFTRQKKKKLSKEVSGGNSQIQKKQTSKCKQAKLRQSVCSPGSWTGDSPGKNIVQKEMHPRIEDRGVVEQPQNVCSSELKKSAQKHCILKDCKVSLYRSDVFPDKGLYGCNTSASSLCMKKSLPVVNIRNDYQPRSRCTETMALTNCVHQTNSSMDRLADDGTLNSVNNSNSLLSCAKKKDVQNKQLPDVKKIGISSPFMQKHFIRLKDVLERTHASKHRWPLTQKLEFSPNDDDGCGHGTTPTFDEDDDEMYPEQVDDGGAVEKIVANSRGIDSQNAETKGLDAKVSDEKQLYFNNSADSTSEGDSVLMPGQKREVHGCHVGGARNIYEWIEKAGLTRPEHWGRSSSAKCADTLHTLGTTAVGDQVVNTIESDAQEDSVQFVEDKRIVLENKRVVLEAGVYKNNHAMSACKSESSQEKGRQHRYCQKTFITSKYEDVSENEDLQCIAKSSAVVYVDSSDDEVHENISDDEVHENISDDEVHEDISDDEVHEDISDDEVHVGDISKNKPVPCARVSAAPFCSDEDISEDECKVDAPTMQCYGTNSRRLPLQNKLDWVQRDVSGSLDNGAMENKNVLMKWNGFTNGQCSMVPELGNMDYKCDICAWRSDHATRAVEHRLSHALGRLSTHHGLGTAHHGLGTAHHGLGTARHGLGL